MVNDKGALNVNIYIIYIVFLLNSAFSYFFYGYKATLLNAVQSTDVISRVDLFVNIGLKFTQCVVLMISSNFYMFVFVMPIFTILSNIIKSRLVDMRYSMFLIASEIDEQLKNEIKNKIVPLMSTKVAVVLLNAADTLVVSTYLGLTEAAMYNNYYFIMTSVESLIFVIHNSMLAGVGNSLVVDSPKIIIHNFDKINFVNSWLVTVCCTCFVCLYQPFMYVWVGEKYMLSFIMVVLFTAYFYSGTILRVVVSYKDAAGIWKQDMFRTYLSCVINIALNIILVHYIGLYGVIGSSVFVCCLIDPWIARTLYKNVFKCSSKCFYIKTIKYLLVTIALCAVCVCVCEKIKMNVIGILIRFILCFSISNIGLLLINKRGDDYLVVKEWMVSLVKNRKNIIR